MPPQEHTAAPSRAAKRTDRLAGAAVAFIAGAVLLVSAVIEPAHEGHGTHTQLGLPACGWAMAFNAPCPTCGMTTSFAHAADGQILMSAQNQPMAALLVIGVAAAFWAGAYTLFAGSALLRHVATLIGTKVLIVGAVLAGAAWIYKMVVWTS